MNPDHLPFVAAAYAVFVVFLVLDWWAPRWMWKHALRATRERQARVAKRSGR